MRHRVRRFASSRQTLDVIATLIEGAMDHFFPFSLHPDIGKRRNDPGLDLHKSRRKRKNDAVARSCEVTLIACVRVTVALHGARSGQSKSIKAGLGQFRSLLSEPEHSSFSGHGRLGAGEAQSASR